MSFPTTLTNFIILNSGVKLLIFCKQRNIIAIYVSLPIKECESMVKIENYLGTVCVSQDYFSTLVGNAVTTCFGVAGMANGNARQGIRSFFFRNKNFIDKGVLVRMSGNALVVDLHIIVIYGLNLSATVKSIVNKVRYTVEEATGLEVKKVNVFIDSMKSE